MQNANGRLEKLVRHYGLVIVFALLCYGLYYRVHIQTAGDLHMLKQMHANLEHDKQTAYRVKSQLTLHWQSGTDLRSRQLILMQELGLVPKGYKKIVFTTPPATPPVVEP